MKRVALIVQRWAPEISAGSERQAWRFARALAERYSVELITTTALDSETWARQAPSGLEMREGVAVRRFDCDRVRDLSWHQLHGQMVGSFNAIGADAFADWTVAQQEEWIRMQGPYSAAMLRYLKMQSGAFDLFVYMTYLYAPTYFGSECTPVMRNLIAPTLHDEAPAWMPVFRRMASRFRDFLWHSRAEAALADRIWSIPGGHIVGGEIDTTLASPRPLPAGVRQPYLLYSGRLDAGKGLPELIRSFGEIPRIGTYPLELVLTGKGAYRPPHIPGIRLVGFVSEDEKRRLMQGALAFVMPSTVESFSIAALEAMAQECPVIGLADSPVVADHIRQSGGGAILGAWADFGAALETYLQNRAMRDEHGRAGRRYVQANYSEEQVRVRLYRAVAKVTEATE